MLVYSGTKVDFCEDVRSNRISDVILKRFRELWMNWWWDAEYYSWQNSMHFMKDILDDSYFPWDIDIAIEYQIPRTSKRVDFMISWSDESWNNNVVIIELKQWQKAEKIWDEMMHSVRTFTGWWERIVSHPSYQAYSYSVFIKNASDEVENNNIWIIPCAYLHNYDEKYVDQLSDNIYKIWYDEAPFFIKSQVEDITNFIKKYISKKSSQWDILYKIDHWRIKPSKALQDCLVSLMEWNKEFILLDDQIVAFDMCKQIMLQCQKDKKKRTLIIQWWPWTWKSVLAMNLLKEFLTNNLNVAYVTKNSAPREAYLKKLSKLKVKEEVNIKSLFRSPFKLCESPINFYDCLIIDEAHRLVKQMFMDYNWENQVKECMNAALFSIFLIDENQKVTTKDIWSIDEIRYWAKEFWCQVRETELVSQFRCNWSDWYIQLVNNILQIWENVDISLSDLNFDIKIFDDPNKLRDELRMKNSENKARMIAWYCYDWNVKNKRWEWDIELENWFKAKWNLDWDKIWAINPKSFEEVWCIHTAQWLEFDYVWVFIWKDLIYDKDSWTVKTNKDAISKDDNSSWIRKSSTTDELAEQLIKNTYKTLLTRWQKGCYIYCEDLNMREYFRKKIGQS